MLPNQAKILLRTGQRDSTPFFVVADAIDFAKDTGGQVRVKLNILPVVHKVYWTATDPRVGSLTEFKVTQQHILQLQMLLGNRCSISRIVAVVVCFVLCLLGCFLFVGVCFLFCLCCLEGVGGNW